MSAPTQSKAVAQALREAANLARALKHDRLGTEHLLWGLGNEPLGVGREVLHRLGVTSNGLFLHQIAEIHPTGPTNSTQELSHTPHLQELLELASVVATERGSSSIDIEDLLVSLAQGDKSYKALGVLRTFGARPSDIIDALDRVKQLAELQ